MRRRLVSRLAPHDTIESANFDCRFRGGRYEGDVSNVQDWHVCFFGGYELRELAVIRDFLKSEPEAVAIDVGANQGGHALTLARYASQVHCFEPLPDLAKRIGTQLALNKRTNVTVHRVGLSDREEDLPYYLDWTSRNKSTGSFLADHNGASALATLPLVRGDDYLKDLLHRLDFMKIDVEGFEGRVLAGLARTLERFQPTIMMEVTESSHRLILELGGYEALLPFGHSAWRISNPDYPLGFLQIADYGLEPIDLGTLCPTTHSYNILVVPHSRLKSLSTLSGPFRTISSGVARRISKTVQSVEIRARRKALSTLYPNLSLGRGVRVGRRCRFAVSDGGVCAIGSETSIGPGSDLVAKGGVLTVGKDGFIGKGCTIVAREAVRIGRRTLIGEYVTIRDQDHQVGVSSPPRDSGFLTAPVTVGDDVWIGAHATITRGVCLGHRSVVGAGAVVTADVPSDTVVAGVPARPIRTLSRAPLKEWAT